MLFVLTSNNNNNVERGPGEPNRNDCLPEHRILTTAINTKERLPKAPWGITFRTLGGFPVGSLNLLFGGSS